jgi:hypothetical protein
MILPSGCYCLIRSKHVCASRDEPHPEHGFCDVPLPLNLGDHHWVTFHVEYWDSEDDQKDGKPPVLTTDVQFGHRVVRSHADLASLIAKTIDSHYAGGQRGDTSDPRWHHTNAVEDVLGLLNHPHVAATEVAP